MVAPDGGMKGGGVENHEAVVVGEYQPCWWPIVGGGAPVPFRYVDGRKVCGWEKFPEAWNGM